MSGKRFIIVYLLLALALAGVNLRADVSVPINTPLVEFPVEAAGWRMTSQTELTPLTLNVLKPTDYLYRTYQWRDGGSVQLYIGFHGGGREGGEIHSPRHCLPGTGWSLASSARTQIEVDGDKVNVVRAVYQKGERKQLFYYWFQVRDRTISDEYSLKLAQLGNSVLNRRRDAAFVRISTPVGADEKDSTALAMGFIRDLYPAIRAHLPS